MNVDELMNASGWWIPDTDDEPSIVVSSRIRLARNLKGSAFPGWAGEKECERIWQELLPVLGELGALQPAFSLEMGGMNELDKQILFERHLISREQAEKDKGSGLVARQDERAAIMVNEEDHLRMQAMRPGMCLPELWEEIDAMDSAIEQKVRFAYGVKLGYLTACPSNVGTGLRASAMLHLPGLVLMGEMEPIIKGMGKIGLAVRGLWGEGTDATGNMFQISNQITLGERETEIIKELEQIVLEVVEHEKNARARLQQEREMLLKDQAGRAFGILTNAHVLSSNEALNLLSALRLGIDLGILDSLDGRAVDELLLLTQPGHLQKIEGKKLKERERDRARATLVRSRLLEAMEPVRRRKKSQSRHE